MFPPFFSIDFLYKLLLRLLSPSFFIAIFLRFWTTDAPRFLLIPSIVAAILSSLQYFRPFFDFLQYGHARKVDFAEEVVVVTGGSRGLGKVLVDQFAVRGAKVAVLDVVPYKDAEHGAVHSYVTDVGDEAAVLEARGRIVIELGTPTILINNAGIVNGKNLLELSAEDVKKNFRVNILSHFHTIRTFLPAMISRPQGGTVITISSVLGDLGAAQLSDYCAAKAGLIAMHNALRAELDAAGNSKVKTLLVKPGQLTTPLFNGVETPNSFFAPLIYPDDLGKLIVEKVETGQSGHLALPLYSEYIEWLSILPFSIQSVLRKMSGADRAMRTFQQPGLKVEKTINF